METCKALKCDIFITYLIAYGFTLVLVSEDIVNAIDITHGTIEGDLSRKIINLDFKNTDLKDLMRLIATKYNLNIFVDENINLKLTMHLSDVTVGEALKFILDNNDLIIEKYGSIYQIKKKLLPDTLRDLEFERKIKYHDGLLSVDLQDVKIREASYEISRISGINIILDKSIRGNISGFIQDLPLRRALFHLFRSNGYFLEEVEDVFRIRPGNIDIVGDSTYYPNFWIDAHGDMIDLELSRIPLLRVLEEISRQVNSGFFFMD